MNKEIVREEEKERFVVGIFSKIKYSRGILKYSRKDKLGEGFGKRKVGMKVKVKEYLYGEEKIDEWGFKYKENLEIKLLEGIIIRIVRRINNGYYDYWYKVKLNNGKYKWSSYVKIMEK